MAADAKGHALIRFVPPALASLVDEVPQGKGWMHEVKYDGYRLQAIIQRHRCRLLTRSGLDWTTKFQSLADACAKLPVTSATLDGEAVVRNAAGATSFQGLQQALEAGDHLELGYVVFDLLALNGVPWATRPLSERRRALRVLLGRRRGLVQLSEELRGDPTSLLIQSCRAGHEGVISKRLTAPYRSGRGTDWLKIKCGHRQEFVVLGFTPPGGSREGLGSLLLGVREGTLWKYAGRVGSGFDDRTLRMLRSRLGRLQRQRSPLPSVPAGLPSGVQWVRPELVVEVSFTEWTSAGHLRHPVFLGIRTDKPALEIRRERAARTPAKRRREVS
jgi:bifunctional non-homologous end joining protein LigD